jgi:hypothetical protein
MEKISKTRRPRGASAMGCFDTSKHCAQTILDLEREERRKKTDALKLLRLKNGTLGEQFGATSQDCSKPA